MGRGKNMPRIPAALLSLVLLALLVLPCPARADGGDPVADLYFRAGFEGAKLLFQDMGFTVFRQERGRLDCGGAKTRTYFFEGGHTYVVLGFGYRNEGGLSLDLMRGRERAQPGAPIPFPTTLPVVGRVNPHALLWYLEGRGNRLGIRVSMRDCDAATGAAYGFIVLRKAMREGDALPAWLPRPVTLRSEPNALFRLWEANPALVIVAAALTLMLLGLLYVVIAVAAGDGGPQPPPSPGTPALRILNGAVNGMPGGGCIPLDRGPVAIGRDPTRCRLVVHDPRNRVSKVHCVVGWSGGVFHVEDAGSTNGTFLEDGRRIPPGRRHPLRPGERFMPAGRDFMFQVDYRR